MAEPAIDPCLHRRHGPCRLFGRKTVDQALYVVGQRAGPDPGQLFAQGRQSSRGHDGIGEAGMDRVGPFMVWPVNPK